VAQVAAAELGNIWLLVALVIHHQFLHLKEIMAVLHLVVWVQAVNLIEPVAVVAVLVQSDLMQLQEPAVMEVQALRLQSLVRQSHMQVVAVAVLQTIHLEETAALVAVVTAALNLLVQMQLQILDLEAAEAVLINLQLGQEHTQGVTVALE
jgi:hypothetical protein